ncbi:hypothetical protein D6D00_03086 [Aureobasidium pullulans]|nr:hypothetical protein D6D00_03086 [Aureobasidium pullulans]
MATVSSKRKRPQPPSAPSSFDSESVSTSIMVNANTRNRDDSPSISVAQHLSRLDMAATDPPTTKKRPADMDEINETPGAYDSIMPSPNTSPTPNNLVPQRGRFILHPPRRVTSPPPSTPIASPNHEQDQQLSLPTAIKIAQDKLSTLRCDSPSTPVEDEHNQDKNMTWQEDEITGHNIDDTADDDGEGINGIGFIPTPAMVTKRSEQRRRQILEWRARESREARQRRYDKRKPSHRDSAISLDDGGGSFKRRMVRFAEA